MKFYRFCCAALVSRVGLFAVSVQAAPDPSVHLPLKQAIRMAVAKNLGVKAEQYNPAAAEATLRGNRGIYTPRFSLQTGHRDTLAPDITPRIYCCSDGAQQRLGRLFRTYAESASWD